MEGTQAAVCQGKYIPSGQGFDRRGEISQRSCDKTTASEKLAVVEVPATGGAIADGHSGVAGGMKPLGSPWSDEEIQYLRDNWENMTTETIAKNLGRPMTSTKSKGHALKLKRVRGNMPPQPRKYPKAAERKKPRKVLSYSTAMDNSGRAADFLRVHDRVPMYRCDDIGRATPKGEFWRYGNAVLADADVIAKAKRKGWDENEWRKLS